MLDKFYSLVLSFPKLVVVATLCVTIFFAGKLGGLAWETDARVYLPKGHAAIKYDELVDEIFGVKDSVIVSIVNEEKGIYNPGTLALIERITQKISDLPGVIANRSIDIESLATASIFSGDDESIGAEWVMKNVPADAEGIARIRKMVESNAELLVGNVVSHDGKAAMIRAQLKEGKENRYMTYFQLKGILNAELGIQESAWPNKWAGSSEGDWGAGKGSWGDSSAEWGKGEKPAEAPARNNDQISHVISPQENGDVFYLAGRPVIEVTSGQQAMADMKTMVPLVLAVMIVILFAIFRSWRGVFLPLFIMLGANIWLLGLMVVADIPLYTISTMMPVIIVAVGLGDAVHFLSHYYDNTLENPHRGGVEIVRETLTNLGVPLLTTTLTTSIGFLALCFAEMPPFKDFGVLTVVGIIICWLLSVTFLPAVLSLLPPKVSGYLAKKKSIRVHGEQGIITRILVSCGVLVNQHARKILTSLTIISVVSFFGASLLYVDSSWMSDFKKDSDIAIANDVINDKFDGTLFLNVVVEGEKPGALRSLPLLMAINEMQEEVEKHPMVGSSLSIVDYIKSMNKSLNSNDDRFNVLPDDPAVIDEYLYLLSISGRPELLEKVINYTYQQANVSFIVKTDHTMILKEIIDSVDAFKAEKMSGLNVTVNYAGSVNNSYIWADLLIGSQGIAVVLSKIGIFLIVSLLFRSFMAGFIVTVPVVLSTFFIAAITGFVHIPLDVSTALAAGVAIGVGVDYAIHFFYRYSRERKHGAGHPDAVLTTLRTVGRTIVFNVTIVALGFLVLIFSAFPPHIKLGYFVAAYMLMSGFIALVILPLFVRWLVVKDETSGMGVHA